MVRREIIDGASKSTGGPELKPTQPYMQDFALAVLESFVLAHNLPDEQNDITGFTVTENTADLDTVLSFMHLG